MKLLRCLWFLYSSMFNFALDFDFDSYKRDTATATGTTSYFRNVLTPHLVMDFTVGFYINN